MQRIKHRAARLVAQGFKITAGKAGARVRGVNGFGADLCHTHPVPGTGHRQLGINGVAFAIGIFFIQQRSGNGIRKAIDRPFQRIVFNFKIKGSTVRRGAGVMATTVHF
ncbi:hypothetical protein D3C76_1163750 [compost metagenome]